MALTKQKTYNNINFMLMKKMFLILFTLINLTAFAQVELVSGGSANAYTLAFPGVFSYSNGISFTFKANFANTGSATINVNSLGAKNIKKHQGADLAANDIKNGQVVTLVYDGTNFQITSGLGNAPGGGGGGGTLVGDVTGDISANTVEKIRGVNVVATPPTTNQVLQYNGTNWAPATLGGGGGNPAWELNGNSGTDSSTNFIGTTDAKPLVFKTNNTQHMKLRQDGGLELPNTYQNTYIGDSAGINGAGGILNTALGHAALAGNKWGTGQIGIGVNALRTFTGGGSHNANIAIGNNAMLNYDITDDYGYGNNISIGTYSMASLGANSGDGNIALGASALSNSSEVFNNTAIGNNAMYNIDVAFNSVALGSHSLHGVNNADFYTIVGAQASAESNLVNATAIGAQAYVSQNNSIVLGSIAGVNYADSSTNVGIGTTTPSTTLHIVTTTGAGTGFRLVDGSQGANKVLTSDANGNASWQTAGGGGGGSGWELTGNLGTDSASNFIGTTDAQPIIFKTNNSNRLKIRIDGAVEQYMPNFSKVFGSAGSLSTLTTGLENSAFGDSVMMSNTTGSYNSAFGFAALKANTTASNNTAVGDWALYRNTTGGSNTAVGTVALQRNTNGFQNTGLGTSSLGSNTSGQENTAVGYNSLNNNVTGSQNTAIGAWAMTAVNTSSFSTAVGYGALTQNTSGSNNTAVGGNALFVNNTGANNTAVGRQALQASTSGGSNTAMGYQSLGANSIGSSNTAFGTSALSANTTGTKNTALGASANVGSASLTNATAIGANARVDGSNALVLGSINGINGATADTKVGVGTTSPTSTLHVEGTFRYRVNGFNPSPGYVLTADGVGNATWEPVPGTAGGWSLDGNGSNNPNTNFIGNVDDIPFNIRVNNERTGRLESDSYNNGNFGATFLGFHAGFVNTGGVSSGYSNSGFGVYALAANNQGYENTGLGAVALWNNTSGDQNTAVGGFALQTNTTGDKNTGIGYNANVAAGNLTNATAVGALAQVAASNSLVLGSINGTNGATASTKVGIGTTAPSTTLHVVSTAGAGTGFRLVDGSEGANKVLTSDANGNATWQTAGGGGGGGSGWNLTGNSGTNPSTDFVGTSDLQPLLFRVNNQFAGMLNPSTTNTSFGYASYPGVSGNNNTAIGTLSMPVNIGDYNSALGVATLNSNTSGSYNTAIGSNALNLNTDGSENVAIGVAALNNNTSGTNNVAIGVQALNDAQTGTNNVAIGHHALQLTSLDVGHNVAVGAEALKNTQTNFLTAVGHRALAENTYGTGNAGFGAYALANNTGGSSNVAIGEEALSSHGFGDNNTALGYRALAGDVNGNSNIAIGKDALKNNAGGGFNTVVGTGSASMSNTGNHNAFFGYSALSIGDGSGITILGSQAIAGFNTTQNTTVIGASTFYDGDNAVRLGNSLVTTVEGPVAYTVASDARFKTNVSATDVKGLDFITKLRPVNYNFDTRKYEEFISKNLPDSIRSKRLAQDFTHSTAIRQTGFIAQEVEQAAKETGYDFSSGLHTPKTENGYYTVAYSQFVVPLVKAVQELNQKVEALEKENAALKSEKESKVIGYKATYSKTTPVTVDDLQNQINELKKLIEQLTKNR